eukprot:CAMPEP_0201700394 /NCGR_PEP_ID=MMETSP0578-20130828/28278_1 /ASSEMBLY_ACC=CAM_ASM_000663 /TAXON_ID=267565 /ORGANISM="Skeletonema grethea, Strain CCMP 1804" /LENGTH=222 /DNA_ID=CAMNT_0048187427 /DNA_START=49 /DNA_END=714 /DNA_ORIENTATION=+
MVIKELVHSDRVNNQSLASIVLSVTSSRKRDRCDAPVSSSSSCNSASSNDADQDCSLFRSNKRVNSSVFNVSQATLSESREDTISDGDDEEVEELLLMHRTNVFREQRQLPETPYSVHFKDVEDDEEGWSPFCVGAHPSISRAKTIDEDSSTDYTDPPEMSSSHSYDGKDLLISELAETSSETYYKSRGAGEDTSSEREQPEWLSGSARPFSWTLSKKGSEP